MTSNQRNTAVLLASSAAVALAATAWFGIAGLDEESLNLALRLSARVAYLLLLVVFVARPLHQMFSAPQTARLLRNRRSFGIAFAGVHITHFGLLLVKQQVVQEFQLLVLPNAFGAFIYLVILAMLITSWNAPARAIGARAWQVLHKTGLYVLFVAFAQAVLPYPGEPWESINWGFIVLIGLAVVIRLTAFLAQRNATRRQQ